MFEAQIRAEVQEVMCVEWRSVVAADDQRYSQRGEYAVQLRYYCSGAGGTYKLYFDPP